MDDKPKISDEQIASTLTIGPVTFTGYAGLHYYDKEKDFYDNEIDVMHVGIYQGGAMISDVDDVDFIYTPLPWCLDFPDGIGRYDTVFNFYAGSKHTVLKKIEDEGITPYPSEKLSNTTWSKGYAWEFTRSANLIVKANGKDYYYAVYTTRPNSPYTVTSKLSDASPTASRVLIDGKELSFEAYNIEGNNYFKLRDVAQALTESKAKFNVTWNSESSCVDMLSGASYSSVGGELTAGDGTVKKAEMRKPPQILKDGIPVFMQSCNINGNNYFKLRDLGKEFNFNVTWDGINNCILIETDKFYTEE